MTRVEHHVWYRQYQKLKAQNPDAILLYRLGDFYETFDDDAKLIAELLEVTLTRREYAVDKGTKGAQKHYCPMAGVPYHAVENYVTRLVGQGYRVAIAEQLSETTSSKSDTRPRSVFAVGIEQSGQQRGIVHREVVRVITPGTVIEPGMLTAGKNNYLAAVIAENDTIGLSYVDLSTGEFAATELVGERAAAHLDGELVRLNVSEVLVPDQESLRLPGLAPSTARLTHDLEPMTKQERETLLPHERVARRLERENTTQWAHGHITAQPAWCWEAKTTQEALMQQFGVQSLAGFGLDQKPMAARAAGAILHYLYDTQRSSIAQITTLRVYTIGAFMFLDPQTRRNLELLEGSGGKARGALVGVLDYTRTPMGTRLLRRWLSQPLLDLDALHRRQEAVACCVDNGLLRAELRQALADIGDMERVVNRVMLGSGTATPRDLTYLRQALRALPKVLAAIGGHAALLDMGEEEQGFEIRGSGGGFQGGKGGQNGTTEATVKGRGAKGAGDQKKPPAGPAPRVDGDLLFDDDEETSTPPPSVLAEVPAPLYENENEDETPTPHPDPTTLLAPQPVTLTLDPCSEALALLERAIDDNPPALLGASNYLREEGNGNDPPRRVIRPGYDQRIEQVVAACREAQNYIDTLEGRERERTGIKSLKVDYNKVFGYFIALPRSSSIQVPPTYERKQTLVNAERYITAELKEYESVVLNAQQRLVEYERDAFARICAELTGSGERLRATARTLARLDVLASLAEAAVRGRYVRPDLNDSTSMDMCGGRHPVVEKSLDELFVPNDAHLDTQEQQILLITGPNMAGKSTVLRQVALIVLMAQVGSFVPAESATIGLVDRIFTRIGAQDDIATGQSTFMVEMTETAALLSQSSPRSLIILDEVGRGTSTYDGMAIARAVVEYIHNEPRLGCRTLFATHYHELTDLEELLPRVKNFHMAAMEQQGRVVFLYELRPGFADRSYGIHVAELAGIPRPVIRRASELLEALENRESSAPSPSPSPRTVPNNKPAASTAQSPTSDTKQQLSLFDVAPDPVVAYLKRLNVNELTPIEAITKLYELQKLAQEPM